MAPDPAKKFTSGHLNFVHNDEIWKDHVRHESLSQRTKWPEKWGYLVQEYNMLNRNLCEIPALKVSLLHARSAERQRIYYDRVKLPPITNKKPTKLGFPTTTNQQIGWIASKPDQQLEVYGRYGPKSRGQCGILKLLSWPQESAP